MFILQEKASGRDLGCIHVMPSPRTERVQDGWSAGWKYDDVIRAAWQNKEMWPDGRALDLQVSVYGPCANHMLRCGLTDQKAAGGRKARQSALLEVLQRKCRVEIGNNSHSDCFSSSSAPPLHLVTLVRGRNDYLCP